MLTLSGQQRIIDSDSAAAQRSSPRISFCLNEACLFYPRRVKSRPSVYDRGRYPVRLAGIVYRPRN